MCGEVGLSLPVSQFPLPSPGCVLLPSLQEASRHGHVTEKEPDTAVTQAHPLRALDSP